MHTWEKKKVLRSIFVRYENKRREKSLQNYNNLTIVLNIKIWIINTGYQYGSCVRKKNFISEYHSFRG